MSKVRKIIREKTAVRLVNAVRIKGITLPVGWILRGDILLVERSTHGWPYKSLQQRLMLDPAFHIDPRLFGGEVPELARDWGNPPPKNWVELSPLEQLALEGEEES